MSNVHSTYKEDISIDWYITISIQLLSKEVHKEV